MRKHQFKKHMNKCNLGSPSRKVIHDGVLHELAKYDEYDEMAVRPFDARCSTASLRTTFNIHLP